MPTPSSSYAKRARLLSIGIATTGLVTFAYFSLASYSINERDYGHITLLWTILMALVSIIYRPIEQLLSRMIAERRAQGAHRDHPLRAPALIQASTALLFLILALLFKGQLENHLFGNSDTLYKVFVGSTLFYAGSYFGRGWLAGHEYFGLYGGMVLLESCSRTLFALLALVGVASGLGFVSFGIVAAPVATLLVLPFAYHRQTRGNIDEDIDEEVEAIEAASELRLKQNARFTLDVLLVMLAEQTLINAGVLIVYHNTGKAALAGFIFNLFLITRAPLQLFQAIQTSLLPHLTGLKTTDQSDSFTKTIRTITLMITAFASAITLGLFILGPKLMGIMFGGDFDYQRVSLALVGLGMGFHLISGTLNQSALARSHTRQAAAAWLTAGTLFCLWMFLPLVSNQVTRVASGYCLMTALLSVALYAIYKLDSDSSRTS